MTIQIGDRIPSATLTRATDDGPKPITPPMLIGAITHVMTMEQATLETSAAA